MDALRSVLPAGTLSRRAEGPRDADHRRARAGQARRLRRRDRLPRLHRRPRHLHPHPHRGRQGRRRPRPGRRRHGGRRAARLRVRGVRGQGARPCCARSSWRWSSPTGREGPRRRQLRLLHLQPRPVPGRARARDRGRPQRPRDASTSCSSGGYDRVVVSPGPCTPDEAGISLEVDAPLAARPGVPHARRLPGPPVARAGVRRARRSATRPVHGKTTTIEHDGRTIFAGLPAPLTVGRYHSLVVDDDGSPTASRSPPAAATSSWRIRHRELPAEGVQFHPESVLTDRGRRMLANFLDSP